MRCNCWAGASERRDGTEDRIKVIQTNVFLAVLEDLAGYRNTWSTYAGRAKMVGVLERFKTLAERKICQVAEIFQYVP